MVATLRERLARLTPRRHRVRDPRRRREYYDGTENPDLTSPYLYARGKRAVPAPPPASGGF